MRKEDILSFRGFYLEGVWLWRISGGYSQEKGYSVLVEVASTTYADIIEENWIIVIYTPFCTPKWSP